jgi:hypothetical protein
MSIKTQEEVKRLKHAVMHYGKSADDYISGRCLVLNNLLITGLVLQVSAIEKILKAMVGTKDTTCNLKAFNHNLTKLFNQVNQYQNYDIGRFGYYIPKLEQIYEMRYHDNSIKEFSFGGPYDDGVIDDFYIELVDQIQIIPEIKFTAGLPPIVFDPYDNIRQHKRWAMINNKALAKKYTKWQPLADKYFLSKYREAKFAGNKAGC